MDNVTNRYNFMLGNIDYINLNKLNQFFYDSQNFLSYANFLYVSWTIMQLISNFYQFVLGIILERALPVVLYFFVLVP